MSLQIEQHPLVGKILRQIDRPWDRFKIVSVLSGIHESIWTVTPGDANHAGPIETTRCDIPLLEIDPDQTDGPIEWFTKENP